MDVTYNFTAGTRAVAGQVNQNFADVKSAVDPLETAVADIETQLTSGIILPDGSVDFTRLQSYATYAVSNATNATPIVVTAVAHGFLTGDKVYISGVGGNTAANGTFTITKIGVDTFSLDDSVGNGAFSSNGTAVIYPSANDNLINKIYADNLTYPIASTANMSTLANNVSDANNDIDFSAGFCYDSATNIKITNTALTKRLDASFVAGTNQGGLDTGSKAISTWYHCFAISKANGTSDFLFSLSSNAPTMPTDFVNKRRIGSIRTDSSGNIIGFYQFGSYIKYKSRILDRSNASVPSSRTLVTLSVPSIDGIIAQIEGIYYSASGSAQSIIQSPLETDVSVTTSNCTCSAADSAGESGYQMNVLCNSSSQLALRSNTTNAYLSINTIGYYDNRGAN